MSARPRTNGVPSYPVTPEGREVPPSYDRVVRSLSDSDIDDELQVGLGSPEYQQALRDEAATRGVRRGDG